MLRLERPPSKLLTLVPAPLSRPAPRAAPAGRLAARAVRWAGAFGEAFRDSWSRQWAAATVKIPPDRIEPVLASASPAGWKDWGGQVVAQQPARVGEAGLIILGGFAVGALLIHLFRELAEEVIELDTAAIDGAAGRLMRRLQSRPMTAAARIFSAFGSEILAAVLAGLALFWIRERRWGAIAGLLIVTLGAQLLNNVLKDVYRRTRPAPYVGLIPAQAFSFPSGHAMVACSFYVFLAYLNWRLFDGWARLVFSGSLVGLVLLIGASRIYLGVHYLTDIVAGYLAGFFWADAVIIGERLLARRFPVDSPFGRLVSVPVVPAPY